ncbi:FlgD immunoglobulin-like domain containing protein [Nocardioides campestrisoli]|uniref:FlgD immunoglobulin-like domain containing protein n=1 Tax=Nocardioides campestrisoli TaxID=2736757 RepID=UPI00163D6F39|nr:FlgD immunoglobulin-like domain containing protein [Nocardioides campestrisoli]
MSTHGGVRLAVPTVLAMLATLLLGGAPAAAAGDGKPRILDASPSTFSPNGDGVRDRLTVRYSLPRSGPVEFRVSSVSDFQPFTVSLGWKAAGRHTWTWDGRNPQGRVVPHANYTIRLRTAQGSAEGWATVDLKFQPSTSVIERYGQHRRAVTKVYPRSRAVRDSVGLQVSVASGEVQRGHFVVRSAAGRVVVRRVVASLPRGSREPWQRQLTWDARDGQGRPLPPGRYLAYVSGADRAGNTGNSKPLPLWVSKDRLEWRKETQQLLPSTTQIELDAWSDAKDPWDFYLCGSVTQSSRLLGGLTHRAGDCPATETWRTSDLAMSAHFLPVPGAVRGVAALRVAFAGEPTDRRAADRGTLTAGGDRRGAVSSVKGARTAWVERPDYGQGQEGGGRDWDRVPAGAYWTFSTGGDDAFDVGGFTVDLRYLAVADQ